MKYHLGGIIEVQLWSLPVRGAWVEMGVCFLACAVHLSLPVRGAWVEMRSASPAALPTA